MTRVRHNPNWVSSTTLRLAYNARETWLTSRMETVLIGKIILFNLPLSSRFILLFLGEIPDLSFKLNKITTI